MKLLYHPAAASNIATPLSNSSIFHPHARGYIGIWSWLAGCGLITRLGIIRAVMILFSVIKYYLLYGHANWGYWWWNWFSNALLSVSLYGIVQFVHNLWEFFNYLNFNCENKCIQFKFVVANSNINIVLIIFVQ